MFGQSKKKKVTWFDVVKIDTSKFLEQGLISFSGIKIPLHNRQEIP